MLRSTPACEAAASTSTLSPLLTETATGWHVLQVEGYSKIHGFGIGRRLKSCPFVVGGHTWCIAYFPAGLTKDTADWISFALRLERRAAGTETGREPVMVRTTFSLLDVDGGGPVPSHTVSCGVWTFSSIGQSWSYRQFMERKEFETSHVKYDVFRVRCDVAVLSSSAAAPQPDLCQHLGDLLASGDSADVTLDVGGEPFQAHKNVLAARSPVFKAEFFGGPQYRENAADRVSIHGVMPSVFRAMLHFVYTDSLPEIDAGDVTAMAQHLLVAADRYGIERLKSICEYVLCTFVDASAVVTTLVLAEQHGCHQLKEECFKVLSSSPTNFKKLVVGEDFEYLASTFPSLLHELRGAETFRNVSLKSKQHDRQPPVSAAAADDADTYGSSSSMLADKSTGWHVHNVEDYTTTKALNAAGMFDVSDTFAVGRYSWRVTCCPNCFFGDNVSWICFGLRPEPLGTADGEGEDLDAAVVVRTSYSLLDQAGQPLPSSTKIDDSARHLSTMLRRQSWSFTRFMKTERFESSSYLQDNRFSVRCDVTLVTTTCRLSGAMPPPDLRRHLGDLLITGIGADVTLEVGGQVFAAHRSVLTARSPVLKAELLGGQHKEGTMTAHVRILDIEPSVFKALLHFIYTNSLPEIDAGDDDMVMSQRLLVVAERYEMEGLKRICEDVLGPRSSIADQMRARVRSWPLCPQNMDDG